MKAKRIFQRIASGVMAGIMLVSTLAVTPSQKVTAADVPSKQDASSAINYATILGRATDFGIVADTFEQKMHMETTLATNTFINKSGNNDVDFIEGTAQFIFGSLGSGSTVPGPIDFGVTTAENFNIETTDSIAAGFTQPFDSEGNFDGSAMPRGHFYFRGTFASKFPGIPFAPHILINTNDENTIKTNVNRIMENAESRSNDISKKASGELKSSYLTDWTEYADASQDSHVVLDLEKEAFENKVVYINVDSKLAKYLAKSEGLRLHKKSSTVVVFNIEDGITNKSEGTPAYLSLRKIAVYVNGKRITSQTGSGGNSNTGDGVTNDDVDREVCQKIIWNIRTKSAISLGTISGTILCPYASSVSIDEQCAGWLVGGKGKHIENNAEFHYIYKGGSQEVMHDGIGEIHFAARKSFTHAWNGQNTEEDTGIFTNAGDYSFNWYETDAKYNTSGVTPTVVKNQATNAIKFPTLHFYTDSAHSSDKNYIANGGNKVFHYVITEVGAGTYKNGVQISNGKVEIELTVKNTNGRLSYTVSSTTYLGDGSVYKQNNNIEMSGVEFTLGAFFNLLSEAPTPADLTISKKDVAGKELPGAVLKLTGKDANGKAVVFDRSKVKLGKDAKMSPATGTTEELIFTSGSEATLIPALPDGEYELEETNAPEGYKVATKIKFKVENGVATLISKGAEVIEGKDGKYTLTVIDEAAPKTDLTISKKDVAGKELPGAVLKLTGKDTNGKAVVFDRSKVKLGKDAKMSPATGTTEELIFTSGSEATLIPALPDGEYELEETNAPEGYKIATKIKFKVANGVITLISKGAEVLEGKDGKYTLTVIDEAKPIEGSTEATIQIEKSVINDTAGSTTAISKAGYEFTLTGTSENAKGKVYSGTTDADGKLTIKISDYDEAGTYEYELKETDGLTAGITYDKTVYKVVVTVEVKDYKFVSPAKVEITKKGSTAAVSQPVKFENHYKAASTKAEIPALKTLSGEGAALKDGQFGFTLSKKGETTVLATARNKADGSVLFTIDYDTPGTYEYVIREVKGSEPGITYDESEFEVTVTVTDDGNGTLKAEVSGSAAAREFKNTYEKKSASENDASFSLKLKKELSGDWSNEKNLKAGDYSFELTIQDSSYYAANKTDGSVEFTDIVISGGDGDYDFTLKEVIPEPKVKGMTYDETVVKGKVSVKDGKATVTAPAGDIVFTNKFNYEPSRFDVSLNKVISKIDGESLEGAVIKFTRDDGNFDMRDSRVSATQDGKPAKDLKQTKDFISFTTTKTITVITGIASGEYTMSEVSAPEGFQKAEDIKITIDDNGKVTATGAMSGAIVVMIDDPFPTEPTPTPTPTPTEPTPGPEEPTVTPTPTGTSTPTPTPKGGKKKVTPTPGGGSGKTVTPTPTPGGSGNGSVTPTPGGGGNGSVTPTPAGGKGGKVTPTPAGGNGSGSNGGGNGSNGGGGKNGRGLDRSPQTGDHNTAGVFAAAGLISLAALAVVTIIEKKKREEQ